MIHVQTFGAVDLRRDGTEVRSVLSQPKRMALLVHLALGSSTGFLNREAILAAFWPDADSERARNSLRQSLHYLRRSLGDDLIESRGDEIGCSSIVTCDALEFERALAAGRLEEALRHYRGDFLPAFFVEDAPAVEAWIDERRGYYRTRAFRAASGLAEHEAGAGELRAAIRWAERAAEIEPFDEAAVRRLMQLHADAGEAAAALVAYDQFESRLRTEHEIDPAPETRQLATKIRGGRPAGPLPATPAPRTATRMAVPAATEAAAAEAPAAGSTEAAPGATVHRQAAPEPEAAMATPRRTLWSAARIRVAAGIGLVALAVAGWQVRSLRAGPETAPAVAVMPFVNMSEDPANAYLADGLAEELLNVLTRVPGVKVAARTSSFSFRNSEAGADSVARALGVTHIVEGSVRASGAQLRIGVQLIEAASGLTLWSESYDRGSADIIRLQDEIARDIAKSLQVRLSPAIAQPSGRETRDAEAYRLLLRSNQVMRSGSTRETLAESAALLEEALRRDPRYARAMAALANVLSWQANFRYVPADSGYARARALAEASLALLPTVEAHLVLARDAELQQWDTAAADAHFRSALELNPVDPRTLQFRAIFLGRTGRVDEGIAAARRATELDPLHPGAWNNLAAVLLDADRLEDAHAAYLDALRVSPEDPIILGNLANLMARQQRWDEGIEYLDRSLARTPEDVQSLALRASILLRSGRRDEGMTMLKQLETQSWFPRYRLAILYSNVGDVEKILDLLEQSVELREEGALSLRSPEMFKGMREHPRFVKLLESIGG